MQNYVNVTTDVCREAIYILIKISRKNTPYKSPTRHSICHEHIDETVKDTTLLISYCANKGIQDESLIPEGRRPDACIIFGYLRREITQTGT